MIRFQVKSVVTVAEFEAYAKERLPTDAYEYFRSGSDEQITQKNNVEAFRKIYLIPRILIDMTNLTLKTKILGQEVDLPFGVSPVARQKILHSKGELLIAGQSQKRGTVFTLSMLTTTKPKDIVKVNPSGLKIAQIYFLKNNQHNLDIIKLLEYHGFKAIAITVDSASFGKKRNVQKNVFRPNVQLQFFNQLNYGFKMRNDDQQTHSFVHQVKQDLNWEDIKWMKKNTTLKIVLKGVISPEDVPFAEEAGVDAIWVSNHGGRQLDTSPATIVVLPAIRRKMTEIKSKMELYIDGGVRTGSDIFKCLALGADFVFLGRGFLFSICFGQEGVSHAFDMLTNQLRTTMMLCGANSLKNINFDFILKCPTAKL